MHRTDSTGAHLASAAATALAASVVSATALTVVLAREESVMGEPQEESPFQRWYARLRAELHGELSLAAILREHVTFRRAGQEDKQLIWMTLKGERRLKNIVMWQLYDQDQATPAPDHAAAVETLPGKAQLVALVDLGDELNGHPGVIHGGYTAALLDDLFGWTAAVERTAQGFSAGAVLTANLNVNYRRPLFGDHTYRVDLRCDRVEKKKKAYLIAVVSDEEGRTCVEATALYILAPGAPVS